MNPTSSVNPVPPTADPFAIGWRDVPRTTADGVVWEQVPLTLEDALHPQEGDTILQNTDHDRNLRYLADVITKAVADDPTALVLVDCKVEWDDPDLRHHSPDVAVIFGVRERQPRYSEFRVADEGVRPRLIIEVVSPSTRNNDVVTKLAHYHRARVPLYVIIDRDGDDAPPVVIGYYWTPRRYARSEIVDGQLWLEPVGLSLGIVDNRAACFDRAGRELGDYTAIARELEETVARAEAAHFEATQEKQRADAERMRADTERTRANAERTRADTERTRAAQSDERAAQAEERAVRLAARLHELGLDPDAS